LSSDGARKIDEVPAGRVSIEGEGRRQVIGDVDSATLKDRLRLAELGVVVASLGSAGWQLRAVGVCNDRRLQPLLAKAREEAERVPRVGFDDPNEAVRRAICRVFEEARGVRPLVIVLG